MGWKDAPEVSGQPAWASAPEVADESIGSKVARQAGNLAAGAVRGAGSIGATILAPVDVIGDALNGKGLTLESNRKRRADMDAALQSLGADTDSLAYGAGKIGTEIAGTLGVGGAAGNALARAGLNPAVVEAVRTAGMSGGSMPARVAGGAVTGALSAGLVNPEDAAVGAAVGGAMPMVVRAAGKVGGAIGNVIRGPAQPNELTAAIESARQAGYVIPPTQAKPTLGNRLLEGMAGKITTAQNASAKNQAVTADLAARAIGLPEGATITPKVLDAVREEAGQAYAAVANLPKRAGVQASTITNTPAAPAIDPAAMVFDLRKARNDATAWFRSYGRTADPDALVKAKSAAATAKELESALEQYAESLGKGDLVQALREARQRIAKTYSIEAALNPTTGAVDARKLAAQLAKGKPLSGELKDAAEFAARFPKAAQTVEAMGSLPQFSPLDWALGGSLAATTANPLALASVMARPAARALALSPVVQDRLAVQGGQNAISRLLANPDALQLGYRAAPVLAVGR